MTENYEGVKFRTRFRGGEFNREQGHVIIDELSSLRGENLLDKNNGNISIRVKDGLIITPSGKDMAKIVLDDLVKVTGANEEARLVDAVGKLEPSSESIMHWEIYTAFDEVDAIVHYHDDALLRRSNEFTQTERYYPYGTIELAHEIVKTLKISPFVIIKDHGAIAVGKTLFECHAQIKNALGNKSTE
jgi:ribulose-5-phosphate 4-epimerase/fuculose-1-phosphate aldolase